jgi:signal peptide peptidase SppA
MSKLNILQALTNGIWLIQPEFVNASSGLVARILNGEEAIRSYHDDNESEEPEFKGAFIVSPEGAVSYGNKYNPFEGATPGSTAILGISGPIMKYDNCGDPGTKTYSSILDKAQSNPNINSVVLVIDSPGGTVDGTMDLATKVKNFSKPIVVYVDGLMASAAYWIGSGAKEIIVNNETSTLGSIGTMISFADMQPKWEKEGVVFHYITADASVDKNKDFLEARKNNYDLLKEKLNSINDLFVAGVTENRAGKLDIKKYNVLTGKTYLGADAVAAGLADAINTFEYAVERAQALANGEVTPPESQTTAQTENQINMKKITLMASHAALLAICGATISAGETSVDVELNDELLGKINSSLDAAAKATADLATANEKVTAAELKAKEEEAKATKAVNDLTTAEAKIRTLETAGSTNATTTAAVEETTTEAKENEILTAADAELAAYKKSLNA